MQLAQLTFLALLLAHLLGDFLLQPKWLVERKGQRLWPLLFHGSVHCASAWTCLLIFTPAIFLSAYGQTIVLGYSIVHIIIDKLKSLFIAHKARRDNVQTFLFDQLLHVIVIAIAAGLLVRSSPAALFSGFNLSPSTQARILAAANIYIGVVFGGGYLIRYLTRSFATKSTTESPHQLENAGLYVGWIERFLVITAIVMQSPVLVGLILTGKSIARFPEFKEPRFAEYFLIGTLLSISLSVFGGILLLLALYGTVSLK
jgi:hypothetical protein